MISAKPTLVVDIDDVLAATTLGVIVHASDLLRQEMRLGDIKSVDFWLEYGVADFEAIALVQGYNDAGFPGLVPVDGAVEALSKIAKLFNIHAVTARDSRVKPTTVDWLDTHYTGLIADVHFVGNKFVSDRIVSKAEICRQIGAKVAIDDDVEHIADYMSAGIDAVVYGDYPWSNYDVMPSGSMRCKTWESVYEYLRSR
jgi:5'(3')-deoxyribonucleotidase